MLSSGGKDSGVCLLFGSWVRVTCWTGGGSGAAWPLLHRCYMCLCWQMLFEHSDMVVAREGEQLRPG